MITTITYNEFKTYLDCPHLWFKIYKQQQTIPKFISYKDLYKSDLEKIKNDMNNGYIAIDIEQYLKALAIQNYIEELNISSYTIDGCEYKKDYSFYENLVDNKFLFKENNIEIELPIPNIFKNNKNEYLILNTKLISSNPLNNKGREILLYLQKKALSLITGQEKIIIVDLEIYTSSIKMKKKETEEEFEKRKYELLKKSKTGVTKAKQQLGETEDEFYERYKTSLKHNFIINKNNSLLTQSIISANIYYFGKISIPLNPNICKHCSCECDI